MSEIVAGANSAYFLWMEVVLEWIFKVTGNHKIIHDWFEQNQEEWECLIQWVQVNRDPPSAY